MAKKLYKNPSPGISVPTTEKNGKTLPTPRTEEKPIIEEGKKK